MQQKKCTHKKHNMSKLFTKFLHLNKKKKALSKVTVKISIQGKEYYSTFFSFGEQSYFFNSGTQQRLMKHARREKSRRQAEIQPGVR